MAETLLYDLQMDSCFEHEGRVRMAEVMKADWWQVEVFAESLEQPGQLVTVQMSSVGLKL